LALEIEMISFEELKLQNMKYFHLLIIFAFVSDMQGQVLQKGPHGGELFRTEHYNIEKVNTSQKMYAYLYDVYMIPVYSNNIEAKVEFFYPDNASCEIKLKPCEENSFCCETSLQIYSYCVIDFNLGNEVVWAKFYNFNFVARKQKKETSSWAISYLSMGNR
jgi:hypothetical protein